MRKSDSNFRRGFERPISRIQPSSRSRPPEAAASGNASVTVTTGLRPAAARLRMPCRIRSKVPSPRIASFSAAVVPSSETRMSREYSDSSKSSLSRSQRGGVSSMPLVRTVAGPRRKVSSRISSISGLRNGSPPVK
jgi:hypothetical protein